MKPTGKIPDETDKQILKLIANGYTYKQVGREIFRSPDAVKKRLDVMKRHYGCKTNPHLIAYCTQNALY